MKYVTLVLFSLILAGCGTNLNQACQVETPGATTTIHSYGDSMTEGEGASNVCLGYQPLMAQELGFNGDNEGYIGSLFYDDTYDSPTVDQFNSIQFLTSLADNVTVGGERTNAAHPWDISTVLPAFNDVSLFSSNLEHLNAVQTKLMLALQRLSTMTRQVYLGTTLYRYGYFDSSATDLYVNMEKSVVASLNSQGYTNIYIVNSNQVFNPITMVSQDYVHPNDSGHSAIATEFVQTYEAHN